MDVSSTIFQPIFEGVKQYVVPLFQRSYSWGKKEWMTLWTDIKELYDSENPRQHFMGSLVTIPAKSVPEGVAKFSLIDGQQRITTLYLILMAMGDLYKESGQIEKYEEIKNIYLVNPYKKGNDYYKILPTQIDRDVFKSISSNPEVKIEHEMWNAYNFFRKKLALNIDLDRMKNIITTKLSIVSIVLDSSDNPYLVFESLNHKGKPLSVADLIRNYGKGEHIWDVYTKEPGKVYSGHTGEVACDHYHRYKEDVQLMKEMGLKAYRFSIDWSRVLPDGFGRVNEKGIEFYNHLIDELVENKIEPYITLYHWELPYEIYKRGGWMNPQIVEWFGEYAKLVAERFSDRVSHFFTLNEPQCFVGLGFLTGEHAPGVKAPMRDTFEMAHNALKAHGRAVQMLRTYGKQKLTIGYAPTSSVCYPETDRPEDIKAARKAYFSLQEDDSNWTWNVSWWSDPVLLGHYPEEGLERYEKYLPKITEEDMRLISEPIDIYGQNIYNGRCFRMGEDGKPQEVCRYEGFPKTAIQWPVTPECLRWGPKFLYERYHKPIYITENGLSCHDMISLDGKVHDPNRIDFLARYLRELKKAAEEVDIRGYFQWSLMDNFEWAKGYSDRFGLVYVDYRNQQRIMKDSAFWYKHVIEINGAGL